MTIWLLVAAAAALLLWPSKMPENPFAREEKPKGASYIDSVSALQVVRQRLSDTQQLGEDQQAAINTLTLALVAGSGK